MHWKVKALIQNAVDLVPPRVAHPIYYQLQRRFGGLRRVNPAKHYRKAARLAAMLRKAGRTLEDRALLEIGAGRTVNVPIGLWLCGAGGVTTVDLNPYLKRELILDSLAWTKAHREETRAIFADVADHRLFADRLDRLVGHAGDAESLLALANIRHLAPADAADLPLDDDSVDIHYSMDVFEHIPESTLPAILREAKRLLKPGGALAHDIDLSDHFAHGDASITAVNFLRFSERQWRFWAGNRFMYHNRLRVSGFQRLFEQAGARPLFEERRLDERAAQALSQGFPLAEPFRGMDSAELAVTGFSLVATLSASQS